MEEIDLGEKGVVANGFDPAAGVTYAWRNLNVFAPGKGFIKKSPKTHILKDGECPSLSSTLRFMFGKIITLKNVHIYN